MSQIKSCDGPIYKATLQEEMDVFIHFEIRHFQLSFNLVDGILIY